MFNLLIQIWDQERISGKWEIRIIRPIFKTEILGNAAITKE
jgi:hypothetical protein